MGDAAFTFHHIQIVRNMNPIWLRTPSITVLGELTVKHDGMNG
jgi:hypothetical protein